MSDARTILVRYDEIGLKGRNRKFFENCLLNNIKRSLRDVPEVFYQMPRGRLLIGIASDQAPECVRRLRLVPGIASTSVGIKVEPDFQIMAETGVSLIEPRLSPGKPLRFAVRAHRSDKSFPKTSPEIGYEVGSRIMMQLGEKGLTVNLSDPEFTLEIEIGHHGIYVFDNRVQGLRGLPVGSSGEALCLLSGGIDSPVAAFMLMRRGCRVHFIFFDNQAYLGRGGYDKVRKLAKHLNRYQQEGRLYIFPFQDLQVAIRDHCSSKNRVVLYRRMMYRIAHAVAEKNRYLGLVTGESLGQVASQTLENLAAVSCITDQSVFRPLIGMDKLDIIAQAKRIETYDISIEPQPDCCSVFMPAHPVTKSRILDLERDETLYPWGGLMQEGMEKMETIELG